MLVTMWTSILNDVTFSQVFVTLTVLIVTILKNMEIPRKTYFAGFRYFCTKIFDYENYTFFMCNCDCLDRYECLSG